MNTKQGLPSKVVIPFGNKEYEFQRLTLDLEKYWELKSAREFNKVVGGITPNPHQKMSNEPTIKLNLYKGMSIVDFENWITNKRRMVYIKILIRKKDIPNLPKADLIKYNFINGIDIDIELLKDWILQNANITKDEKSKLLRQVGDIIDRYDDAQLDQFLGSITIPFSTFQKIFSFLGSL